MTLRYVMGTFLTVHIAGQHSAKLADIFLDEVGRLESLLSRYRPESDISRINRAAGHHPVAVHPETFDVLTQAIQFACRLDGAFDPTVERLGYLQIVLVRETQTVFLPRGLSLDLGAIGKGFALDRALACVRAMGDPEQVSADFGGHLLFWHQDGRFPPETIFVEDPVNPERMSAGFQVSSNCSISTSSNAQRPGHLRNLATGDGARGQGSTTIVARTATEADAFSTAFFIQERFGVHHLI